MPYDVTCDISLILFLKFGKDRDCLRTFTLAIPIPYDVTCRISLVSCLKFDEDADWALLLRVLTVNWIVSVLQWRTRQMFWSRWKCCPLSGMSWQNRWEAWHQRRSAVVQRLKQAQTVHRLHRKAIQWCIDLTRTQETRNVFCGSRTWFCGKQRSIWDGKISCVLAV